MIPETLNVRNLTHFHVIFTYLFYFPGKRRYNIKLWKTFTDCFNCLPVAAIVDEKIFCCHGGLSPDLQSMEQIRRIMRPTDVPDQGLLCDLLWSDPDKVKIIRVKALIASIIKKSEMTKVTKVSRNKEKNDSRDGTVWKFSNYPATLILREINSGHFEAPKTTILTI